MRAKFKYGVICFAVISILIIMISSDNLAQIDKWQKNDDRGNRYEGTIGIPLGKPDLELLSFVSYLEEFNSDVNLKVRFFLPKKSDVLIYGQEIRERKHYLMESKPDNWVPDSWNEFGPWQTQDVIDKEKIPHSNLGVVVYLSKDKTDDSKLAPAFIYHSNLQNLQKLPSSVSMYSLWLRPFATLTNVKYSLCKIVNNCEVVEKTGLLPADKIVDEAFCVKIDMKKLPDGPRKLYIEGDYKGAVNRSVYREYEFFHKSQIR